MAFAEQRPLIDGMGHTAETVKTTNQSFVSESIRWVRDWTLGDHEHPVYWITIRGVTALYYWSRERNETVQLKGHQVNSRIAKEWENCFQFLAQDRLNLFPDFLLLWWFVWSYAASLWIVKEVLASFLQGSQGGKVLPLSALQGAGMLLGLHQIRNHLLGMWILNKGSSTVEVARDLYYRDPYYSSF